jgi:hypothetical protein
MTKKKGGDFHASSELWYRNNPESIELATQARSLVRGRDVLFHGTRYRRQILASGLLMYSRAGSAAVHLTRSASVAADQATLPRDDNEGSGSILILDRQSLRSRCRIECYDDGWFDYLGPVDEFEERIWGLDIGIADHLVGVVSQPLVYRNARVRRRTRERVRMFDTDESFTSGNSSKARTSASSSWG